MSTQHPGNQWLRPTTSPTTTPGDYFGLSKFKIIAIIVSGVVLIGGLGAISAAAFSDHDERPQGTSDPIEPDAFKSLADQIPGALSISQVPVTEAVPISIATEGTITIGGDTKVPIPRGWKVDHADADNVALLDGKRTVFYAFINSADTTDAATLVAATIKNYLPQELYTKVKTLPAAPLPTMGTMLSRVGFQYDATRTDLQSALHVHGFISIAVRPDKKVLILNAEHSPPKEWQKTIAGWMPIHQGASYSFGGIAPP